MKQLYISCLLFTISCGVEAQTLCRKGEFEYFSCPISKSNKVLSVCGDMGSPRERGTSEDSWIQYRFGKPGAVELQFPREKRGSLKKFEGNYFGRYSFMDLRFINEKTKYSVTLYGPYDGPDADERKGYSGSVSVTLADQTRPTVISCRDGSESRHWENFKYLNIELEPNKSK